MARKSRKNENPVFEPNSERAVKNAHPKQDQTNPVRMPVGAYIRLSAENNGQETDDSIQTQISLVKAYIEEQKDLELVDVYVDNGYTGTSFERPEFIRMMEDVKKGIIQGVVVKDLSRFGRDYLETGYYIETVFPLLNVRLIAITDHFDSSRETDRNSISVPIKNMVNAMFAKDVSRKQGVFHEMCRKTGKYVRYTPPFGYVYSEETQRFAIDTSVEPYVRLVFAWALAGIPRSVIAQRMEILNAPTSKNRDNNVESPVWTRDTVKAILTNPVYAGYHVMGKSMKSLYQGVTLSYKKREDWLLFPDYHEAYISKSDYKKIEDTISQNIAQREERLIRNASHIERMRDCFPRMVYCGNCGKLMSFCRGSHHRDYSDRSFQCYRCHNVNKDPLCSNMLVQQNYLKIVVMDQLKALIQAVIDKRKLLVEVQKQYEKPRAIHPIERNIHRLEERENILDERLLQAYTDFADGLLDEDAYILVKAKYTAEKESTVEKKKEFTLKLAQAKKSVERYLSLADHLEELINTSEFSEELVKELVSKIIVYKDKGVELVLKCQDVFNDTLVSAYLEELSNENSVLFEAV